MAAAGAWVAFYEDWSDVAVFSSELAALRYAVGRSGMSVVLWQFGMNREQALQVAKASG